jgi:predicted nucleic acid-binding protein
MGPPTPGAGPVIHLDTSALVDALTGAQRSAPQLRLWADRGERMSLSTLVLYEWLRGPRLGDETKMQELLFPAEAAVVFGPQEATLAAELYRTVRRARSREFDLAVAACALSHGAALWTLNHQDFRDIPGLTLV